MKSILKLVKTCFKRLLEYQNDYIDNFLHELEMLNDEVLKGNTDILYKKLYSIGSRNHSSRNLSPRHTRVVQWETNLGPSQKDFLYGTYMETLWTTVKNTISKYYIASMYDPSLEICRMNDVALSHQ